MQRSVLVGKVAFLTGLKSEMEVITTQVIGGNWIVTKDFTG